MPPGCSGVEYRRGCAEGFRGSGHPRARPPLHLLRDQSWPALGRGWLSLREPAERLLAPPRRLGPDAAAPRPERAARVALARLRAHERRAPHDEGERRPSAGRLRRGGGAAPVDRRGAAPRRDRVRRESRLPGRVRARSLRARPAGAVARVDEALRAPVYLARERRGALRGAAPLVP